MGVLGGVFGLSAQSTGGAFLRMEDTVSLAK